MPVQGPIHVDRALTNLSIAYRSEGLVADQLFPVVPVKKESDVYFIFDKANSLRTPLALRANGSEANSDNLVLSTASYRLDEHALKEIITERDRENADEGIDLEVATTEDLTDKVLREKEVEASNMVFTGTAWANVTSLTSTLAWSANTTLSSPIIFADSASSVILQQTGMKANTCLLDYRTFLAAKEHISVVDRIKYTSSDSVTPDLLARLFGVEKLLIASGAQNTADEGLAVSMSYIWTDAALFMHLEQNPGLRKASALYCFKNRGAGVEVRRFRDDPRKGDWIEVSHMYDLVAPASDCGYLINNTVQ